MMYPRLMLARNLLRDDGVIFISIDDNEVANLRKICDEIFGEANFITTFSRVMKSGGAKGNFFTPTIDFILCFAKDILSTTYFRAPLRKEQIKIYYKKKEKDGPRKGELYGEERLYKASLEPRINQRYWIKCPDGSLVIPPGINFPDKLEHGAKVKPTSEDGVWKWTFNKYMEEYHKGNIVFKQTKTSALVNEKFQQSKWNIYNKVWLKDQQEKGVVPSNLIEQYENRQSAAELKALNIFFNFAKPTRLNKYLLQIARVTNHDIILDFFAGSCTTAHSVMKLNAEDGGKRKYIMVQLPEPCDEKSEAYKAGFKTIADIGKERIRRAAKKIKEEHPDWDGDTGFRVFKLDSSNIKAWNPKPPKAENIQEYIQKEIEDHTDNILPDRTEEDILYELLLKLGLDLCVPIETREIVGKTVYSIGAGVLMACLDKKIKADEIEELGLGIVKWHQELEPSGDTTCVFRDSAFENDIAKTNLTAILEQNGISNVRSL